MSFFVIQYFCVFKSRFLSFFSMFKRYWKNIERSFFINSKQGLSNSEKISEILKKEFFCWKYWKKVFRKYWKALVLPSLLSHCRLLGNIWWLQAELFICSVTATTITHHGNTSNATQATHQIQRVFKQPPFNKQIYLTQIPVQRKFRIHQHQRHNKQKNSYFQNFFP